LSRNQTALRELRVWDAYWQTVVGNPLDWVILVIGLLLVLVHIVGLVGRVHGTRVLFVQDLDRYRTFCLLLTELLPVLGLLGTVFSLMNTFRTFQVEQPGEAPDLSKMVQAFAPAMSTTISGLVTVVPNLLLNAFMWLLCPVVDKG
jgi:hypothetical protein